MPSMHFYMQKIQLSMFLYKTAWTWYKLYWLHLWWLNPSAIFLVVKHHFLHPGCCFTEIESIGPAPFTATTNTTRSRASSVETLNHDNKKSLHSNNNNHASSTAEVLVDNIPKEKSKEGICCCSFRADAQELTFFMK